MADLYVHTSDAEIEAMSCMEAFACGLVPVIADSPRSATPQFALDERSLFPAGDTDALAERIDWWIEHPAERQADGAPLCRARQTVLSGGVHPPDGGDVPSGHCGAAGGESLSARKTEHAEEPKGRQRNRCRPFCAAAGLLTPRLSAAGRPPSWWTRKRSLCHDWTRG